MKAPSVLSAVTRAGLQNSHRPSIVAYSREGWRQASCEDLAREMLRWAAILYPFRPTGSRPGDHVVVIVAQHGLDAYAAFLGAMRAGLVACFLPRPSPKQDPSLYWANHRDVLARIGPAAVVSDADLLDHLRAVLNRDVPLLNADDLPLQPDDRLPDLADVEDDNTPALLQHSSGTTGLKKGVILTHGQIRRQVAAYAAALSMTADDTVASWLPLYHDMGLITGFLLPLSLGSPIVCMDPFDWLAKPDSILVAIKRFRAAFCWLPNFAFAHLCNTANTDADYDLSSVRAFVDCSEPCRAETLQAFEDRFSRHGLRAGALTACYAMAETVFAVTQSSPERPRRLLSVDANRLNSSEVHIVPEGASGATRLVSCGTPISGTAIRIVPIASRQKGLAGALRRSVARPSQASHVVGEIQVESVSAFGGYHRDLAATAACLDGTWYKTGDLGFLHDGELYVTGRLKDLIIVNGRNFYAHDIEAAASSVPGVKPGRAVAFAVERSAAGSDGAVVLAETAPGDGDYATLARNVKQAVFDLLGLTLHHVGIRQAGALVKTTSGKLCRHENRRRYAEEMRA